MLRDCHAIGSSARRSTILSALAILSTIITGCLSASACERVFTVKDSIELTYFVNPTLWTVNHERSAMTIESPDERWILVITQRGLLATNTIEATIWRFDRHSVISFVSGATAVHPRPVPLARFRASTNTPVISDVRWLENSREISFLAQNGDSYPGLYI